MKKFGGALLRFLSYILIVAALSVPALRLMTKVTGSVELLSILKPDAMLGFCVTVGAIALLVLIGSGINAAFKKGSYAVSIIFGVGAFGALLYYTMFTYANDVTTPILGLLNLTKWSNETLIWVALGAMVLGLIMAQIGRRMMRSAKARKEGSLYVPPRDPSPAYTVTSRDTDRMHQQYLPPQTPQQPHPEYPRERYVRDPWGNLIREEEYNERINRSRR